MQLILHYRDNIGIDAAVLKKHNPRDPKLVTLRCNLAHFAGLVVHECYGKLPPVLLLEGRELLIFQFVLLQFSFLREALIGPSNTIIFRNKRCAFFRV